MKVSDTGFFKEEDRYHMSADPGSVMGYAWPQSVQPGESFELHLSSGVGPLDIEIFRVGAERHSVWRRDRVEVGEYEFGENATSHGCGWPSALRVTAGADWTSGYYEIVLTEANGGPACGVAFVVVRSSFELQKRILLVLGTNTWNAYNDVANGLCLYTGASQVSFQRPMAPGFLRKPLGLGRRTSSVYGYDTTRNAQIGYRTVNGLSAWCGSAGWPNWEEPFVRWAERENYEFDMATNADLEDHPELLSGTNLVLSVGHDEYWSKGMRDAVENFISGGGNVAFLSGNTAYWQVRIEESGTVMVCHKYGFERDPLYGTNRQNEVTSIWSDSIIGRPENTMTGVSFTRGGYARIGRRVPGGSGGYTVYRPEHWLFEGTGLEYGDLLGASSTVVGYECDGCDFGLTDGIPYATGVDGTPNDFVILATSPAEPSTRESATTPIPDDQLSEVELAAWRVLGSADRETCDRLMHGNAVLGTYRRGGTVVTTGCTEWAHGLAYGDRQVEQVTRNILDRLGR